MDDKENKGGCGIHKVLSSIMVVTLKTRIAENLQRVLLAQEKKCVFFFQDVYHKINTIF
jgi:hypothetical protein